MSIDDFLVIVKAWIIEYFKDPQYYRISNLPVVFLFPMDQLGDVTKQALDAARQLAKDAGL